MRMPVVSSEQGDYLLPERRKTASGIFGLFQVAVVVSGIVLPGSAWSRLTDNAKEPVEVIMQSSIPSIQNRWTETGKAWSDNTQRYVPTAQNGDCPEDAIEDMSVSRCVSDRKRADRLPHFYWIDPDGSWFLRLDANQAVVDLYALRNTQSSHFQNVMKMAQAPMIFVGTDMKVSFENLLRQKLIEPKQLNLFEAPSYSRLRIVSPRLTRVLVEYVVKRKRPIISFLNAAEDYWAGSDFDGLSGDRVYRELQEQGRPLYHRDGFLCSFTSKEDILTPTLIERCSKSLEDYAETETPLLKVKTNERDRSPHSKKMDRQTVEADTEAEIDGKWRIDKIGEFIYASVNGDITHRDRLRIRFVKGQCDEANTLTTFYTQKGKSNALDIENQTISGRSLGHEFLLKILFFQEHSWGARTAWLDLGWTKVTELKSYINKHKTLQLKLIDDQKFKVSKHFDITENSWSAYGMVEALDRAQSLCETLSREQIAKNISPTF
ncbi:MAG: hypothetical protein VYA17_10195 [Pseudomonadota bacterium]|nr:hypothetical protein [Pseudomonadota bacterium]